MSVLSHLDPAPLWNYFEEICRIPRTSRNEYRIRKYLLSFAAGLKLEAKEDETGNILIIRQASPGFENRKTMVLQSHMDMVGEKDSSVLHDWLNDPVIPVPLEGWVAAKGTTLGADDGIGIAAQMAILADRELKCGKIECLFTVDEETGMTGAINMKPDFISGRILLNLDSEDEGILFIGCAGGIDTVGTMAYDSVAPGSGMAGLEISITGLHGGHSGDEIHKGYANAIKLMNSLLADLSDRFGISLASFNGGNLRNAIPREAFATVILKKENLVMAMKQADGFLAKINEEYNGVESGMKLDAKEVPLPSGALDYKSQNRLLEALDKCPHGVLAWSREMEDLVETSTNLAIVRFESGNSLSIITSQRSSSEEAKLEAAASVETCLKICCNKVNHSEGYPGWKPDISSAVLDITRRSYLRLFGREPLIKAIHAGLECAMFFEKINGIDMISFGPTIKGAHTPQEKIETVTVRMFWDLLLDVIANIPAE